MTGGEGRITFLLDGRRVEASSGDMLLPVARREGADIPSLCHVEGLSPGSACRLCLVEVEDGARRRVVTSCDYPLEEGIRVWTTGPRLERLRRGILELHLARVPSSRRIRDLARKHGVSGAGGLRVGDPGERCILCGLCARVCSELVGAHAVTMAGRGGARRATLPYEEADARECIGCGACSWVCPESCIEIEPIAIERMRSRWGDERPCRYALMGLVPGALCAHDYGCRTCPFDHEMFERAGGLHPAFLKLEPGASR